MRLAERLSLDEEQRAVVYYVSLLAWVGCHSDAHEQAKWFGDDIALKADLYADDLVGLAARRVRPPSRRRGELAAPPRADRRRSRAERPRWLDGLERSHCAAAADLADAARAPAEVRDDLRCTFERWDGKGPTKLEKTSDPARRATRRLTDVVEVFHRAGGVEAAVAVARKRSGTQFDPELVERFCGAGDELLGELDAATTWDAVIDAEPSLRLVLSDEQLDAALEAIADFTDLKSPYTAGHSRGVADLAADAATRLGLPGSDAPPLRRAGARPRPRAARGLQRGLGQARCPDPARVGARPAPPVPHRADARVRARLWRRSGLSPPSITSGSTARDTPRGLSGDALGPAARVLAAADCYHAMREPRPHRAPLSPAEAEAELRRDVASGLLDGDAVDAVLAAAGHRVRRRREWPAGLTPREIEVLRLLARGASNKEIGATLVISPKTAGNHVEHIYLKTGARSRAAASLFAMRHGLVDPLQAAEK